jgi:hypothetical protein
MCAVPDCSSSRLTLFTLKMGEEGSIQDKVAYDVQEWRRNSKVGEGKATPISRVRKDKEPRQRHDDGRDAIKCPRAFDRPLGLLLAINRGNLVRTDSMRGDAHRQQPSFNNDQGLGSMRGKLDAETARRPLANADWLG